MKLFSVTTRTMLKINAQEALGDVIELKEDDSAAVEAMVRFMYENEYDSSGNGEGCISPMLFNVMVYRLADKYGVTALKQLSKEKFGQATSICWGTDDFLHVITDVYGASECEELRDIIAHVSHEHVEALVKKDGFLRVLDETSGFASDLIRHMTKVRPTTRAKKYECPSCEEIFEADLLPRHEYCCLFCGSSELDWSSYAMR